MPTSRRPRPAGRLPYVQAVRRPDGADYLYYRRAGRRTPLPGPEGSVLFLDAYDRAHASHTAARSGADGQRAGSVAAAITAYLAHGDFAQLAPASQRSYRRTLDGFRGRFGDLMLRDLDSGWWEALRAKHAADPIGWNMLRSRMREVVRLHRRLRPGDEVTDPFHDVRRLRLPRSEANRPWPAAVLAPVLRAATPEFRALLTCYLLTAQRGGDVIRLEHRHYDATARRLRFVQGKTAEALVLHVPDALAEALAAMQGRHQHRLLVTPRGAPWTLANAQETLARLLRELGLPRYTLHGLRATGPTAATERGISTRQGRSLTGHTSDATYEHYVRGAATAELAQDAQREIESVFGDVLREAEAEGNRRQASGARMGRPAVATRVAKGKSLHGAG